MNKRIIIIALVALIVLGTFVHRKYIEHTDNRLYQDALNRSFNLDAYHDKLSEFPCNTPMGSLDTWQDICIEAMAVWIHEYGERDSWSEPFVVAYDREKEAWLVQNTSPESANAEIENVIIDGKTNTAIAVWRDW